MNDFNTALNDVLRYGTDEERQSFEQSIDANPNDGTNRLVYADWLQEQGEHDEAEFQRAMGKWVGSKEYPVIERQPRTRFPFRVSHNDLPEWADKNPGIWSGEPHTSDFDNGGWRPKDPSHRNILEYPGEPSADNPNGVTEYHAWISREGMETALRKEFHASRSQGAK